MLKSAMGKPTLLFGGSNFSQKCESEISYEFSTWIEQSTETDDEYFSSSCYNVEL